jgi:hypothetical protein
MVENTRKEKINSLEILEDMFSSGSEELRKKVLNKKLTAPN